MKKITAFFLILSALVLPAREKSWLRVAETLPNRPDGAFIRLYAGNVFRLFGVGSAAFDKDVDNDGMLRTEKQASMKARAELIKFIQQDLSASDSVKEAFRQAEREVSVGGQKQTQSRMISEQEFLSQIKSTSAMMLKGIVTLKVITIPKGNGGIVKALVGVSSVTQDTAADVSASAAASVSAHPSNAVSAPVKKDNEWIECIGRGGDRGAAVQAALIEGVQQVYGVYLENEESMKKRFAELKTKSSSLSTGSTVQTQRVLTQSRGFIREYRIISVTRNGTLQEARVHAWIVNPRSGGVRTIMLYPMSISLDKAANNYDAGPDLRLSGTEMAALCSRKFEEAFNQTNKFVVLNKSDMEKALAEQNATSQLVLAGKALPLELAKAGQILCADYIFVPEFEDISYTKKIGFDKKAGKFLPRVTLRLSFRYKLIDVRTGSQIRNEELSVMINDQEIRQLPEEGSLKSDMLKLLLNKTVMILSQRVNF